MKRPPHGCPTEPLADRDEHCNRTSRSTRCWPGPAADDPTALAQPLDVYGPSCSRLSDTACPPYAHPQPEPDQARRQAPLTGSTVVPVPGSGTQSPHSTDSRDRPLSRTCRRRETRSAAGDPADSAQGKGHYPASTATSVAVRGFEDHRDRPCAAASMRARRSRASLQQRTPLLEWFRTTLLENRRHGRAVADTTRRTRPQLETWLPARTAWSTWRALPQWGDRLCPEGRTVHQVIRRVRRPNVPRESQPAPARSASITSMRRPATIEPDDPVR